MAEGDASQLRAGEALRTLLTNPVALVRGWNWKSALLSAMIRGSIFFFANLGGGVAVATDALVIESSFYIVTAGFYGAILQSFRRVEPFWHAILCVTIMLPLLNHSLEFILHWWGRTQKIAAGMIASVLLSLISATFNLYVMRRGVLIVGAGRQPFRSDLRRMPRLVVDFLFFLLRFPGVRS
jgi:hypothetical protein